MKYIRAVWVIFFLGLPSGSYFYLHEHNPFAYAMDSIFTLAGVIGFFLFREDNF